MAVSNDTDVVATGADVTGVQSTPDAATKSFSAVTDQEAAIRAGIELSKMAPALMQIGCSLHLKWGMFMRASRISVPPDDNRTQPTPPPYHGLDYRCLLLPWAVVSAHVIGPGRTRFHLEHAERWSSLMQFADGPLAFQYGVRTLRKLYSPDQITGSGGDPERLAYLEELAAAPQMCHFQRPSRWCSVVQPTPAQPMRASPAPAPTISTHTCKQDILVTPL